MTTLTTRVFMNGNSQAVRIPAELRLDTDQVEIRRTADGDLILHPLRERRGDALLRILDGFDDELIRALEEDRAGQTPAQERSDL
ncbi:AbrB/MazE/SpoVT family DNA-binding domain-containing protein [Thiohalocapsa halophila]|uniref:AbrB/MazE/SpoVT family DNA-binding domain-containing protein n=1 Tax=Thiohalocapsa halophila TaxID=69359 RepID=A0ABS1CH75_9GAMM|nr:AbrB/MazE/SpoVT family DNA-binding domain-containing protein [Thiohalocapsa halophila]MBK1631197.1 AbrB/MazE/SpoVT family DNA-binding domain-containing protein [Thiohalocapsa halophila]